MSDGCHDPVNKSMLERMARELLALKRGQPEASEVIDRTSKNGESGEPIERAELDRLRAIFGERLAHEAARRKES